jgi:pimeloyl-ACP methyl ester carboxylesterase
MLRALFERPREMRTYDPVERPGQVLIITAKDDTGFKPPERQALWATYPGAHIHEFESGGHLAGVTRRDEYNALIASFLKESSASEVNPVLAVPAVGA